MELHLGGFWNVPMSYSGWTPSRRYVVGPVGARVSPNTGLISLVYLRTFFGKVRAACLRGLYRVAEHCRDYAFAVANAVLPACLSMLDDSILLNPRRESLRVAAALGTLVFLAPIPPFWSLALDSLLHRAVLHGYVAQTV